MIIMKLSRRNPVVKALYGCIAVVNRSLSLGENPFFPFSHAPPQR